MTSTSWLTNYSSHIGIQSLKKLTRSLDFKMSLPTAHRYVVENLMENLSSIEKNFLKPNILLKHLTKTEKVLNELVEVLSKKDFSEEEVKVQLMEHKTTVPSL